MKIKKIYFALISIILVFAMLCVTLAGCEKKPGGDNTTVPSDEEGTTQAVQQVIYSEKPASVKKSETVYVNLDGKGATKSIIVSDWIHTDKACVAVDDKSDLKNIVNIKGNIYPVVSADKMVWHMDSTDLYYRGESNKDLPIGISIKYFLNGTEISPEELVGKDGSLKIEIKVENKVFTDKTVDGEIVRIYNPVLVAGGMILNESNFTNINFTNGTTVGDGTKQIAVMVSAPGVGSSLGLDGISFGSLGDMLLADTFTVTADVTSCTLGNMYFAVIPMSMIDVQLNSIPTSIEDLENMLAKIRDIKDAIDTVDFSKILSLLSSSDSTVADFTDVINSTVSLYNNNKALISVLSKYLTQENLAIIKKTLSDLDNSNIDEVYSLMQNPIIQAFIKNLPSLTADLEAAAPILESLSSDMQAPEVQASIEALPQTIEQLNVILKYMNDNEELITELTKLVTDENLEKLNSMLKDVDPQNAAALLETYGVLADEAGIILDKAQELIAFGKEYKIFTDSAAEMETNVMFVYQTPSFG